MEKIRKRLLQLEKESSLLEPKPIERNHVLNRATSYAEDFIDSIDLSKSYNNYEQTHPSLESNPINDEPISIDEAIELLKNNVDQPGINSASGGHLGYIPGGGVYYSAVGDYLSAVFNKYAGIYFSAPGAVKLERQLLQWMADIVGYPRNSGGDLTSGSSVGVLMAINAAREKFGIKSKNYDKTVVYISDQAHHSLEKALRIAGMADCIKRALPLDDEQKIIPKKIKSLIRKDKEDGLMPWMIFATAGTTDCGIIDPLEEIGIIANQYNLWYHIDAAYGGFFILTEEGKSKLKGLETSHSIALDPHKGLSMPFGIGAILVKDKGAMVNAHNYQANYMQDAKFATDELSPSDLSPELTKHFRGLRMWLPLKLHGLNPFKRNLEEKLLLAKYFYHSLLSIEGFEVGKEPDLSIVTFRYIPKNANINLFNERLVKEIHKDGRVFLTSTQINHKVILRLAIVSFRTHISTIDLCLKVLREKVEFLDSKRCMVID